MPELKGIKQVTAPEYTETSEELRKGYIWFVRHINESGDTVHAEVYLGNRKYGEINDSLEILVSGLTNDVSILSNEVSGLTGDIVEIWDAINSLEFQDLQVNVTYDELYALKHFNLLKPGVTYRITDYECTTSQEDTRSAGHQFDILVKAVATNALSEIAHAAHSSGDTYFQNCKLDAWELKYDIENNTRKYPWAVLSVDYNSMQWKRNYEEDIINVNIKQAGQTEPYVGSLYAWSTSTQGTEYTIVSENEIVPNETYFFNVNYDDTEDVYIIQQFEEPITNIIKGKGVIYYMRDEFYNEVPYDFKNIQFKRYALTGDNTNQNILPYLYDYWQNAIPWHEILDVHNYCGIINELPNELSLDTEHYNWYYTFSCMHFPISFGIDFVTPDERFDTTVVQCQQLPNELGFILQSIGTYCHHNTITSIGILGLNNIVLESFLSSLEAEGTLIDVPIGGISNNVFDNCMNITKPRILDEEMFYYETFKNDCLNNRFTTISNITFCQAHNNNLNINIESVLGVDEPKCSFVKTFDNNNIPWPFSGSTCFQQVSNNTINQPSLSPITINGNWTKFKDNTISNVQNLKVNYDLVNCKITNSENIELGQLGMYDSSINTCQNISMNNLIRSVNNVELVYCMNVSISEYIYGSKLDQCMRCDFGFISNSTLINCGGLSPDKLMTCSVLNSQISFSQLYGGNYHNSIISNAKLTTTSTAPYTIETLLTTAGVSDVPNLALPNLPLLPQQPSESQNQKVYIEKGPEYDYNNDYRVYYAWTFNTGVLDRYVTYDDGETWGDVAPFPFIPSSGDTPSSWTGLRFTAQEDDSTITYHPSSVSTAEYSNDNGNSWNSFDNETVTLNNGDEIYVRGTLNGVQDDDNYSYFDMSGTIAASGNINSLIGVDFESITELSDYCYSYMFSSCTSLTTTPELPATTLSDYCYEHMFSGCTSLTTAPELPATTLSDYCYCYMFSNCTSLTTPPELPATTLSDNCYSYMFSDCTSLTTAPELPATTLSDNCYSYMFSDCTSLTTAPELPATTISVRCYFGMFEGCTSLTTAPELPATTLSDYCYSYMFKGCTSLTTPPELPSTTLAYGCYESMFSSCTLLTTAPELPATTLSDNCYSYMFSDCTSLTTAPELPATTISVRCYFGMFEGCTSLTTAPELPATTLSDYCYSYMFKGCTSLTTPPELPATTLPGECYSYMFKGCTSLTTAPELPATTLSDYCYEYMFSGCTLLTTAPELPATTLSDNCYSYMFSDCTSLTTAPELPATTISVRCYFGMFEGCTSLTTAPELPATTLPGECYSYMFKGCTSLTTAPELPATTLSDYCYEYMFSGCTSLTEITSYAQNISSVWCLRDWLYGVPSTGDFYNYGGATYPEGASGIPSGWTEHTN